MLKTYIKRHSDGMMQSVSRGLSPEAGIAEYKRLLAREDMIGQPWTAVLRSDLERRTVLLSRFDRDDQRLLPTDRISLLDLIDDGDDAIAATRAIVAKRNQQG